jgi:chorismate mutase/prephenate dehydratase
MSILEERNQLDQLDEQMAKTFVKRMEKVAIIAEEKKKGNTAIKDPAREREVLHHVTGYGPPELETYIKTLYQTVFSLSRTYQKSLHSQKSPLEKKIREAMLGAGTGLPRKAVVACQGVEGSYSQLAATRLFSIPSILYFNQFENVFQAVNKGLCQYGVLPIENSTSGSVPQVYDLMKEYDFHIVKGLRLKVQHHLFAKPGTSLGDIREIWSHPQALDQCSAFLKALPGVEVKVCENTALAAKMVAESGQEGLAAIASSHCGSLYGLIPLKKGVENHGNNYTRFICISKSLEIFGDGDKISLMLSVPHEPGALFDLLSKFAALGVNVSKIESRPIPGTDFEFMFYFDLEASQGEESVLHLMGDLEQTLENFQFLGWYGE